MKRLKKIHMKNIKANIYIEKYNPKYREEDDRCKIYDSNKNYLDYIPMDFVSKYTYKNIIKDYALAKSVEDFLENYLFFNKYDSSKSIEYLLYSVYEDLDDEQMKEIINDLQKLNINQFIQDYGINQIGETFFMIDF